MFAATAAGLILFFFVVEHNSDPVAGRTVTVQIEVMAYDSFDREHKFFTRVLGDQIHLSKDRFDLYLNNL